MKKFLFFALALCFVVACDNDDESWDSRDAFYVNNLSSYYLSFEGSYRKAIFRNRETEYGLDELNIAADKWIMNISIKWEPLDISSTDKDSILELKNYVFYPTSHKTVKNDTVHMVYHNHYYIFTDSVLRDMKDSMKVKGIMPKEEEEY